MISDPAVFVEEWQQLSLPGPEEKLSVPALDPARTALLVIDLNRGFAEKGALYSPLSRALLPEWQSSWRIFGKEGFRLCCLPIRIHPIPRNFSRIRPIA